MKILILSNFGMGLYKFRKELLQELISLGHEIVISLPDDEYVSLLKNLGCEFIESKVDRRGKNPINDIRLFHSYIKIIRSYKPSIVLTYTIKPNIYGGMASRIMNKHYIVNITGLGTAIENPGLIKKLTLMLYKISIKKAKCVFFQNESNKEIFIENKIINAHSKVIPGSGVNLEEHKFEKYPKGNTKIKFLYVGRIMKEKGIDELIEAAIEIKKTNINVEFHVVGFCEEEYLEQMKNLDKLKIIYFHGQKDNVHKYIKDSHAIILPSYHEGLSNVLLEAASTGRPILASNIVGCKETFEEGTSGYGFECQNKNDLVKTIYKFLALSYEDKEKMGIEGRKKMEKEYDRKIIIDAYVKKIEN